MIILSIQSSWNRIEISVNITIILKTNENIILPSRPINCVYYMSVGSFGTKSNWTGSHWPTLVRNIGRCQIILWSRVPVLRQLILTYEYTSIYNRNITIFLILLSTCCWNAQTIIIITYYNLFVFIPLQLLRKIDENNKILWPTPYIHQATTTMMWRREYIFAVRLQ